MGGEKRPYGTYGKGGTGKGEKRSGIIIVASLITGDRLSCLRSSILASLAQSSLLLSAILDGELAHHQVCFQATMFPPKMITGKASDL